MWVRRKRIRNILEGRFWDGYTVIKINPMITTIRKEKVPFSEITFFFYCLNVYNHYKGSNCVIKKYKC